MDGVQAPRLSPMGLPCPYSVGRAGDQEGISEEKAAPAALGGAWPQRLVLPVWWGGRDCTPSP